MKMPIINSKHRVRVVYYHNRYDSKSLFDELAAGCENLICFSNKIFAPRIISIKKTKLVKVG
jgi:hypothetical protein